jgi:hypothetical protein
VATNRFGQSPYDHHIPFATNCSKARALPRVWALSRRPPSVGGDRCRRRPWSSSRSSRPRLRARAAAVSVRSSRWARSGRVPANHTGRVTSQLAATIVANCARTNSASAWTRSTNASSMARGVPSAVASRLSPNTTTVLGTAFQRTFRTTPVDLEENAFFQDQSGHLPKINAEVRGCGKPSPTPPDH